MSIDPAEMVRRTSGVSGAKAWGRPVAALVIGALLAGQTFGATDTLSASQDPVNDSYFTLDFAGFGGVEAQSAFITSTSYELVIDRDLGTARFAAYRQDNIEPLMLPGGISTGPLTIEVVPGSSTGSYDPVTQEFSTTEIYSISFEEDLSIFGFESPVLLPSASTGRVSFIDRRSGTITMEWAGAFQLENPFGEPSEIPFTYSCEVNTQFARNLQAVTSDDKATFENLNDSIVATDLSAETKDLLLLWVDDAINASDAGDDAGAVDALDGFNDEVNALRGGGLDDITADTLIAQSDDLIAQMTAVEESQPLSPKRLSW